MHTLMFTAEQCPNTWAALEGGVARIWISKPHVSVEVYTDKERRMIGVRTRCDFSESEALHPATTIAFRYLYRVLLRLGDYLPREDHKGDRVNLIHLGNAETTHYGKWPTAWSVEALLRALQGGLRDRVRAALEGCEALDGPTLNLVRAAVAARYGEQ